VIGVILDFLCLLEFSGVAKGKGGRRSAPGGTFMGAALWAMVL